MEAVSLDEEMAEQMAKRPPAKKADPVRMRDWSPLMEAMATQIDRLGDIVQAVIAAQGGKPPKIKPFPRPKTAMDKLNDPWRQHQKILSRVMITQLDGSVISAAEMTARRRPGPRVPLH